MYGHNYKTFEAICIISGHLTTVLIYLIVIVNFKRNSTINRKISSQNRQQQLVLMQKRASRIVSIFGIFACLTFVTVVVPYATMCTMKLFMTDTYFQVRENVYNIYFL